MDRTFDIFINCYLVLTLFMWAFAATVRVLGRRGGLNESARLWLEEFSRLRRLFGWAAVALFAFAQLTLMTAALEASSESAAELFDTVSMSALILLITSFYLGALWFMLGGNGWRGGSGKRQRSVR